MQALSSRSCSWVAHPQSVAHGWIRRLMAIVCVSGSVWALTACNDGSSPAGEEPFLPVSLLHQWSNVEIEDPVAVPPVEPIGAIRFAAEGMEDVAWKAISGIEDLRLEDGVLKGRTVSDRPVLLLELPEPMGRDDQLWSAALEVSAGAGTRAALHPMGLEGPPMPELVARMPGWPLSTPLEPGSEAPRNYTIELDKVFHLIMGPAVSNIRRIAVAPTNAAGTDFTLESVSLTFRKERLASIPSGPGWHDLGEIFRETLISRSPESLNFDVDVPERGWLDLDVGSVESIPPVFEIMVEADGRAEVVASHRVEKPEKWSHLRVDLSRWSGRRVALRLRAIGEREGTVAFWGAPTVRQSTSLDGDQVAEDRPQAVIVFLIDTLRSDHLDAWGHDRETAPTLTRLASEGVRFADAVSQATWTKVSVSSMLTSLYPSTTGVLDMNDRVSAGETTLAEVYRQAGYATFATSSVPFSGQLTNLHQGVEVMHELGALGSTEGEYRSKTGRQWLDLYLPWLEQHRDVPTFALIHAMDPHSPFKPEPPFDTMWSTAEDEARFGSQADQVRPKIKNPLMRSFMAPSRQELEAAGVDPASFVQHERNWYDGSIRGIDAQVDRLMTTLGSLGLADHTLLAVVSDHGEELLDHDRHFHGTTVYGEVANVPLIFWGRDVPQAKVVGQTVQNIDIMPTLLELSSLETPERAQGRSLVPMMERENAVRPRPAFVEFHKRAAEGPALFSRFAVVGERYKLIWNVDAPSEVPEYELYDHDQDPLDQDDLAAENPELVEELAAELTRWKSWAEARRLDDDAATAEMSPEELEQLRSLGYIE